MNAPDESVAFEHRVGASTLRLVYGDLATVAVDVLVASDDVDLIVDGGVAMALAAAGGDGIYAEARARGPVQLGDVVPTTAGRLPARRVFHTIVVDRKDRTRTTKALIRSAVRRALELADEAGLSSIAFPALATGAGQFSAEASAMAMIVEIHRHLRAPTQLTSVTIVLHHADADVAERFHDQLRQYVAVLDEIVAVERDLPAVAEQARRARSTLEDDAVLTDPRIAGHRWATRATFENLHTLEQALQSTGGDPTRIRAASSALKPRPLVVSLHGIRTRGAWQKEITYPLNAAGFDHDPLDYDRFGLLRFVWPWARDKKVRWFRDEYFKLKKTVDDRPSVIAHSLGSYIVANAMATYDLEFDRVVFCGAIVPKDYDWASVIGNGGARYVLNDYGGLDFWVWMAPQALRDAGLAGLEGFSNTAGGRVLNRRHDVFRHSDYFYEGNYVEAWIPFLQGLAPKLPTNPRPPAPNRRFRATLLVLLAVVFLVGLYLWLGR